MPAPRRHTGEGAHLGAPDVLTGLAADAGLDPAGVRTMPAGTAFADAVRADLLRARHLGVSGVPSFVFNGARTAFGAESVAALTAHLDQALAAGAARTDT
ncbi:DsbA family oxidoreductase [Murinocardiopsis flavida]|uniref:DsbA family oxidoreductase n=1 Tax=Murinocardiopsis flavida TaxID=645275 RepID=UPI001472CCE9|nr:DsbA family protein [Murinocardiopsis flavida]